MPFSVVKANAHDYSKSAAEAAYQIDPATDKKLPCTKLLWKKYLTIVISGACRYADRMVAARIPTDDKRTYPACEGKICHAKHWIYESPYNGGTATKPANKFIEAIAGEKYSGQHRARSLKELYDKPSMYSCGIYPDVRRADDLPATEHIKKRQ